MSVVSAHNIHIFLLDWYVTYTCFAPVVVAVSGPSRECHRRDIHVWVWVPESRVLSQRWALRPRPAIVHCHVVRNLCQDLMFTQTPRSSMLPIWGNECWCSLLRCNPINFASLNSPSNRLQSTHLPVLSCMTQANPVSGHACSVSSCCCHTIAHGVVSKSAVAHGV